MHKVRLFFPKKCKLTNAYDFKVVFLARNKIVRNGFCVFFRKNDLAYSRLGISVPKRVVSKSVSRNILKRAIREHFRKNKLDGVDLVVKVIKDMGFLSKKEIAKNLRELWEHLGQKL